MSTAPGLRLFLDSAETAQWQRLLPTGAFHGVTTNPLLLQRAHEPCTVKRLAELSDLARDLGAREIQLQTWGESVDALVARGRRLANLAGGGLAAVVKVPATAAGFSAARQLLGDGIAVTMTAVYTPAQVLLAAGSGAAYAAPYLGRLDDAGRDGVGTVLAMHRVLAGTSADTRLLVASLRSTAPVVALAAQGLDTFTFGPAVADAMLADDLTEKAAAQFEAAARQMGGERD